MVSKKNLVRPESEVEDAAVDISRNASKDNGTRHSRRVRICVRMVLLKIRYSAGVWTTSKAVWCRGFREVGVLAGLLSSVHLIDAQHSVSYYPVTI